MHRKRLPLHPGRSRFQAPGAGRLEGHERGRPTCRTSASALAGALEARRNCCRGRRSKSWDNLPATPDIVITVRASAAGETCPAYLGQALRSHWGVEDPAHATGSDAEIDAAFMAAYRILRTRIEAFLALPLAELRQDPTRLKAELDRIGGLLP